MRRNHQKEDSTLNCQRSFIPLLFFIATGVLIGCFSMEHVFHFIPCHMCILERYPYALTIVLCLLGYFMPSKTLKFFVPWALIGTFLASAGLSFYHVGLENQVFELPHFCGGGSTSHFQDVDALKAFLKNQKEIVRCDLVPVRILGLSLATWNLFLSLGLLGMTSRYLYKHKK